MRYGKPILADTFNRHLKQVCKELEIEYRSSHQIRFTMATMFYDGGIKVNELSNFLGCKELEIEYRSSHQIRFTMATMFYDGGIKVNELSNFLGHSDTKTTFH